MQLSELNLIVSHDAGGAEIISSWVKHHSNLNFWFMLEGPAISIFKRKLGEIKVRDRKDTIAHFEHFTRAIIGNGDRQKNSLEFTFLKTATEKKLYTCVYLDHWVHYDLRLKIENTTFKPNEVWAGDKYAFELAQKYYPTIAIKLVPNLFLEDLSREVIEGSKHKNKSNQPNILYVAEPIFKQESGYTDLEAIENYMNYLSENKIQPSKIRLRQHPSEPENKYLAIVDKYSKKFLIEFSKKNTLIEDLIWSDWVVGCDTAALAAAVVSQKKVFSCIPKTGKPLTIPFEEIIKLF